MIIRTPVLLVLLPLLLISSLSSAQVVIWADALIDYSSEYDYPQYGAEQVIGKPNKLPASGTSPVAWAPYSAKSAEEFLEVRFAQWISAKQVVIGENDNPGAVRKVFVGLGSEEMKEIASFPRPAAISAKSRMLRIAVPDTIGLIDKVRIELCGSCVGGFNQIDAIGLADFDGPVKAVINLVDNYSHVKPENLGRTVNSGADELAPIISPDGNVLYFSRKNHPENAGGAMKSDIWLATLDASGQWGRAVNPGKPLNTSDAEAIAGITGDGSMMLINGQYNGKSDGQYISFQAGNSWIKPELLQINGSVNEAEEGSYHLSSDGNILLSSLKQDGGYGGKDIYVSFRLGEFSFSMPENLGPTINTAADEITPFLAPDGNTLYFSSKGFSGYGHSDIFIARKTDENWEKWTEPRNMGPDINSSDWDAYFSVPADGVYGYFSSFDNAIGKSDIFRILLDPNARPDSSLVLTGVVLDGTTRIPVSAKISGKWGSRNRYVWSQPQTGKFSIARPPEDDVEFIVEKDSFLSLRVFVDAADSMVTLLIYPIQDNVVVPVDNIFFEKNTARLTADSHRALDEIFDFLLVNPGVKMEVRGHTNDLCSKEYCLELSLKRAKAVRHYLVNQGVPDTQLKARGYGKSQPVQSNETPAGRKANQRVEFVIRKGDFIE